VEKPLSLRSFVIYTISQHPDNNMRSFRKKKRTHRPVGWKVPPVESVTSSRIYSKNVSMR